MVALAPEPRRTFQTVLRPSVRRELALLAADAGVHPCDVLEVLILSADKERVRESLVEKEPTTP